MSRSTDDQGRISLPEEIREEYGDRYRVVGLPTCVALFPVDDDPLSGLQEAVGDAFEAEDPDALKSKARASVASRVDDEEMGGN
jgi:hypothetical protein